jgi:DNA-directed RNA polymerase subunit RPC12/RpoP
MTVSYMCAWCGEKFEDVVQATEHQSECDERPLNDAQSRWSDGNG